MLTHTVPALSLGRYRITASLEGFQTEVRSGVILTLGRNAVVDLMLTVFVTVKAATAKPAAARAHTAVAIARAFFIGGSP